MITIGIDPDTRNTAVAVLRDEPWELLDVFTINNPMARGKGLPKAVALCGELGNILKERFEQNGVSHAYLNRERVVAFVEGQQIYTGRGATRNFDPILYLAMITGASVLAIREALTGCSVNVVKPAVWKGQLPKQVCHARAYTKIGISHFEHRAGYAIPSIEHFTHIPASHWKHLGDAVALALWGAQEIHAVEAQKPTRVR